jgi:hypothetical protein
MDAPSRHYKITGRHLLFHLKKILLQIQETNLTPITLVRLSRNGTPIGRQHSFESGKFEPVSASLQSGFRFFRILKLASPTVCLMVHLPASELAEIRGFHVPRD